MKGRVSGPKSEAHDAAREATIQHLMSEEGTRWYGKKIPRWKAEQMVLSDAEWERSERLRTEENARMLVLAKRLHGKDHVGKAFAQLCKAGCDPVWLEDRLLGLARFPFARDKAVINAALKRRLHQIVRRLDETGKELGETMRSEHWVGMLMTSIPDEDWPAPPEELPLFIRGIAYCLRECLKQTPQHRDWRHTNPAAFRIPQAFLVETCPWGLA